MSLTSRFLFFPLVITSDTNIGAQCSSIDFAFHSTAWPLILLEKHCKLQGKGSLLTRLTSRVSAAACPGLDELSPGSAASAFPARGAVFCRTFSGHVVGAPGVRRCVLIGKPGERRERKSTSLKFACCFQAYPPACQKQAPSISAALFSVLTLRGPFIHLPLCFWETLIIPPVAGIFRGKHIFFC